MTEQSHTQTQQPYPQPAPPPYKRLLRSSWDAPISGVCGGLAAYLGRLKTRPSVARVLAEAEPFFQYFPLKDG
jgi:hypothetical protein